MCHACMHVCMHVCVCAVIPFILDVRFVDVPAGVTQEEGHTAYFSTFFLRGLPYFLSREGSSYPFPSSTVKSNFVYPRNNRSPLVWHDFFMIFFCEEKSQLFTYNRAIQPYPTINSYFMLLMLASPQWEIDDCCDKTSVETRQRRYTLFTAPLEPPPPRQRPKLPSPLPGCRLIIAASTVSMYMSYMYVCMYVLNCL